MSTNRNVYAWSNEFGLQFVVDDRELALRSGTRGFYEIFAYGDPAWSYALGAQPNVGGVFKSGATYNQVDLGAAPYNFGSAHKGHSAQFRSDNMRRAVFWNALLIQMGLKED
jgi:hypothetical protein